MKKTLSILLAFLLVLTLVPMGDFVMDARAATGSAYAVGDIVEFGSYKQSAIKNADGETTGFNVEPLKWRILKIENGKALLITEEIIDNRQYNSTSATVDGYYGNNYAHSDIREWLINDFYNTAFSSAEKNCIVATTLDNSAAPTSVNASGSYTKYSSESTTDKVFLLSKDEANAYASQYFGTTGTDYAYANGMTLGAGAGSGKGVYWLLRTAGNNTFQIYYVHMRWGEYVTYFNWSGDGVLWPMGVRPAIYVDLENFKETDSKYLQPCLSPESAATFIGFLTNNKSLTQAQIESDPRYKIMTNTYTGSDKPQQITALINFAVNATSAMASKSIDNSAFLNKEIINYLESELGRQTEIPESEINSLQNTALNNINEIFYDLINDLLPVSADSLFKVTDIYDSYSSVIGTAEKAKVYAERITAAIESCFLVMESEKAGRYTYFNLYINNRGSYSSNNDEIFKCVMSHNRMVVTDNNWMAEFLSLFKWITGKDSFNNHFDTIDEWAEYIYQLSCYNNDCQSETVATQIDNNNLTYSISATKATISNVDVSISGAVIIPNDTDGLPITSIANNAFEDCAFLESVKIGDNIEAINQSAFKGCSALKAISMSNNITRIENNAFENCDSLEQIVIPNKISFIGDDAFKDCSNNLTFICDCKNKYVIEYCISNGYNYSLTHSFNNYISNNDGNCLEYGTLTSKCDDCDFTDTIYNYKNMECSSGEWEVTIKPTLTKSGIKQKRCNICHEVMCGETFLFGDTNDDSDLSVIDLINIAKKIAGVLEIESWQICAFDVNCDGKIDVKDIVRYKKILAGFYDVLC